MRYVIFLTCLANLIMKTSSDQEPHDITTYFKLLHQYLHHYKAFLSVQPGSSLLQFKCITSHPISIAMENSVFPPSLHESFYIFWKILLYLPFFFNSSLVIFFSPSLFWGYAFKICNCSPCSPLASPHCPHLPWNVPRKLYTMLQLFPQDCVG